MTTNANAPVETRHKGEAKRLWDYRAHADNHLLFAQSLANLEAANNRLAEIDRQLGMYSCSACDVARALASGHTPSPCPDCAAKDEAMEAMRADLVQVGEIAETHWKVPVFQLAIRDIAAKYRPPADPVAEAFRDAFRGSRIGEIGGYHEIERKFHKALKDRGLELSRLPLGGAK